MACLAGVRHAGLMVIEVTRIGGDGSICRAVVDTAGRDDAARWERLAQQAALEVPPPYRPEPGQPVYQISAGGHAAQVAEKDLAGPLRELVSAVLSEGNHRLISRPPRPTVLQARCPATGRPGAGRRPRPHGST